MRILLICNKSPYPPLEGGPIAMNMMIDGLLEAGHTVKVLAINTNKYFTAYDSIPVEYREKTNIELHYTDLSLKPLSALHCLITRQSLHAYRFNSPSWLKPLKTILDQQDFDLVQIETIFMAPALDVIRAKSKAKIVLRAHNVEYLIWKRVWESTRNPLKRWYMNHIWLTLNKFEDQTLPRFDGIIAITEQDASLFRSRKLNTPVVAIPFGIRKEKVARVAPVLPPSPVAFHIGSMDWIPNQEGIRWLIEKVWPEVKKRLPQAQLLLAGRNMPPWLLNANISGVENLGEVPNAREFMLQGRVMVVPLFSGSGIRIKIVEALAAGKAVITTSVGAEGIECTHNHNILIANDIASMIEALVRALTDDKLCNKLSMNAIRLIEEQHLQENLISKLEGFYQTIQNQ